MASQQDIRRRIASVQNTRKITKAMEMVAAARLRRSQQRIEATRPYAEHMLEFIGRCARFLDTDISMTPLVREHPEIKTVTIIPLTSDRGMCGAFNSNIVRRATELVKSYQARGINVHLVPVGRKGISTLRFHGYKLHNTYSDVTDRSALLDSQALANRVGRRYANEETDRVHIIFNRFKSPMEQYVIDQVVLPIQEELAGRYCPVGAEHMAFIYDPSEEAILDHLLPAYLEMTIFRAMLESIASEHGARMTAMRNASDAANDMIDELTLAMNRVRQASITNEILEVIAGADALSG